MIPSDGDSIDFSHLSIRRPRLCPLACECLVAPAVRDVREKAFRTRAMKMEIPQRDLRFQGTADIYLSSSKCGFYTERSFAL